MLELYKREFKEIIEIKNVDKRDKLLASLMTKLEGTYKIPMSKRLFELEIDDEVREFYLIVSRARRFSGTDYN